MASTGGIRAGRAFVEVFLKDRLSKGLGGLQTKLKAFSVGADAVAASLFRTGALIGTPLLLAAKQAASAQEELSRFDAVFGDLSGSAGQFAEELADSIGRSPVQIKKALASFQSMFKGLKFGEGRAKDLSEEMQSLALDFASFNNLSDKEALERFISGLSGSSEVFDRFGINTKAAAINEQLLAMGIEKTTANATEQEKVLARIQIIRDSMQRQGAIGDAFRTKDSAVNQVKALQAAIETLSVTIGNELLPALVPAVNQLTELTKKATELAKQNPEAVAWLPKLLAGIFGTAATAKIVGWIAKIGKAGITLGKFVASAHPLGRVLRVVLYIGAAFKGLSEILKRLVDVDLGKMVEEMTKGWKIDLNGPSQFLKDMKDKLPDSIREILFDESADSDPVASATKGKSAKTTAPPIMPNRASLFAAAVSGEEGTDSDAGGSKKKLPDPSLLSSAAVLGTGEVMSRLLRASRSGFVSEKNRREKQMLDLQKQVLEQLKNLNETAEDNTAVLVG